MFLRPFESDGDWDREAALQQLLAIKALYVKDDATLAALGGAENDIVVKNYYGTYTWPPAWVVFRSHDDQFFAAWAGTTNTVQVVGHILGSAGFPANKIKGVNYTPGEPQPNLPWQWVAESHVDELLAAIAPVPAGARFRVSGHSYGAAVAQVVASELIKRTGKEVQCFAFGSPKVWTKGFPGPYPSVFWRIESAGDPVTVSPFDLPDPVPFFFTKADLLTDPKAAQEWTWFPTIWEHQGRAVVLYADGSTTEPATVPVPLPHLVSDTPVYNHLPNNYFGRVLANATGG